MKLKSKVLFTFFLVIAFLFICNYSQASTVYTFTYKDNQYELPITIDDNTIFIMKNGEVARINGTAYKGLAFYVLPANTYYYNGGGTIWWSGYNGTNTFDSYYIIYDSEKNYYSLNDWTYESLTKEGLMLKEEIAYASHDYYTGNTKGSGNHPFIGKNSQDFFPLSPVSTTLTLEEIQAQTYQTATETTTGTMAEALQVLVPAGIIIMATMIALSLIVFVL